MQYNEDSRYNGKTKHPSVLVSRCIGRILTVVSQKILLIFRKSEPRIDNNDHDLAFKMK
jgi:hypothetical protein